MSKNVLKLAEKEYLTDLGLVIEPNQSTFLVAPTGAGKTTFTMEKLKAQFKLVLILVPTQAKVMELQNQYIVECESDFVPLIEDEFKDENKHELPIKCNIKSEYLFFCANENPDNTIREFKGVIVATYDKFEKIIQLMSNPQKKEALLVIDETHKLYSAGSFRDDALTPIIWHLQKRSIPTSLFLTATKTTELFDQLKIEIDQEIFVKHKNPPARDIRVTSLPNGDQYTAIAIIEQKVKELIKSSDSSKGICGKTIIVRVNSRDKCEIFKQYFKQRYKLNCIVVHSKTKGLADVKDIFKEQKIPTGVDIVFTTSIMDEAVNLNNPEIEIDSVFVLGKQAHVEELVQFIGRLRIANVPCHILLHTGLTRSDQDPEKLHRKHQKRLDDFITRVNDIAHALASLAEDYKFDFQDNDKPRIYDKVNRMNESFKDWFDCKLFAVYQGKSIQNTASLVSALYLIDTSYFYSSYEYMAWRIKQFLPNCKIQFREDSISTPSYITDFFNEQKANADKAYAESINPALKIFLEHFQKNHQKPESLKQLSTQFIEHKQLDEDYIDDLAYGIDDRQAYPKTVAQILNEAVYLAQHIGNIHDISQILTQKKFNEFVKVTAAYKDNEFVRNLTHKFYKLNPEKYLTNKYQLKGPQASKLLCSTLKAVQKQTNLPMKSIIKANLIKGMSYDFDSDLFKIDESKALNFLASYFDVIDRNKNKPERRYLEFQGIALGGFEYLHLKDWQGKHLVPKEPFVMDGKTYDAYTGATNMIRKGNVEELDEIFG